MAKSELKGVLKIGVNVGVKTGLHIGGSKEDVEIGGIDNIVEKLKVFRPEWDESREYYDVPYIPGSSLKGKLRSLLELVEENKNQEVIASAYKGDPCQCGECRVCKMFGVHQAKNIKEPVRLRIEDLYPTKGTIELWDRVLESGYVEVKTENMINRIRGVAQHPRHTERVIAGSEFEGYITIRLFNKDDNIKDYLELLKKAFYMLEDDYLGASGSRGYGRVKIRVKELKYKGFENGEYKELENSEILTKAKEVFKDFMNRKEEAQKC